jgi:hypothetical protein
MAVETASRALRLLRYDVKRYSSLEVLMRTPEHAFVPQVAPGVKSFGAGVKIRGARAIQGMTMSAGGP